MRWRFPAVIENRAVGRSPSGETEQRRCQNCRHFQNDPRLLEAAIPGLVSFGSGNASVRADDGLCLHHARYVAANAGCPMYGRRTDG